MPKGRTMEYAMWRACERLKLRPTGVLKHFEDNPPWIQAMLIAYSQIRDVEDAELAIGKSFR